MDTIYSSYFIFSLPAFALLLTVCLIPMAKSLAIKGGYVDNPGGRKHHAEPVPPIGGIVIFSVFMFLSLFINPDVGDVRAFYGALLLILVTGIVDDAFQVPAKLKFFIHFIAAFLVVVPGGVQIETLGNLLGFGELNLGWATVPFSIACVVYIINAVNMMDGLDGLAGGKCLIILLWLMIAAALHSWWEALISISVLAMALVGFLYFNMQHPFREKATIFLGDAGSMALGVAIAWFSIGLSQGSDPVMAPVSVAWIIALPIIDAFGLLVARMKDGKHPFEPDRRHFHHHFLDAGFTVKQSTALILLWGGTLGAVGFVGYLFNVPEPLLGWAWIALWIGHTLLVMKPKPFVRLLIRLRGQSPVSG